MTRDSNSEMILSLFLDLLQIAYYYNTELSTSNQGYRKPDFILKNQILWEHLEKLQKIKLAYSMTKIRPKIR